MTHFLLYITSCSIMIFWRLCCSLFIVNKNGFPVLPKSTQALVKKFVSLKVQFIIEGRTQGHNLALYQQYLDHIVKQTSQESVDPLKQFATGYEDFLQSPLQVCNTHINE